MKRPLKKELLEIIEIEIEALENYKHCFNEDWLNEGGEKQLKAYQQIQEIIKTHFLIINLESPDYAAGYEQGLFDEKMNHLKEKELNGNKPD